ncbi:type I-E CRISPR-associated protein Cas6/Cse3/CasE [Actinomadura gamaensis]|uniref:Type I-E CRISPR-associated protein Cas6/Cse3/CasE n=1 Tax=Actinomadura gamaensis TaxID=1763541 RepID=A0ABV9TTP5_9ACTN
MYLTRFRINTARVTARRLLASPQNLHAAVMSGFADAPDPERDGARVLWRLDTSSDRAQTHLYIVSPAPPDLTHLVEQAGWPTTAPQGWKTYDYAPLLTRLAKGDRWRFRLTANPVHTARRNDDEPTKLTAHVGRHHQKKWLLDRQQAAGFQIVEKPLAQRALPDGDEHELLLHNRRQLSFSRGRPAKTVSLVTLTYDGLLEVTDPQAFRHTLTNGLGRAKAYGCGLITLAPA